MSILAGFALLNSAIRGIRTDNQHHDERMAMAERQKAMTEYQMNDPRMKLQRQQAAAELEPTRVNFGENLGKFDNPTDKEHFNRYTLPAIKGILPDGVELNSDYQPVYRGTNTPVEMPAWQAKALGSKVRMSVLASRMGHNKLDMEIDKVNESLAATKQDLRQQGSAKNSLTSMNLKLRERKLKDLIKDRSDPRKQLSRLLDTNAQLTKMRKSALTDPNIDDEFYQKMNDFHKVNNDRIKELALLNPEVDTKNLVKVQYTKVDKDGRVYTRDTYVDKLSAAAAPTTLDYGDGIYTLGTVSNVKKADDGEGGNADKKVFGRFSVSEVNSINDRYTKAKVVLSATKLKDAGEDRIIKMLTVNNKVSPAEAKNLVDNIKTDAAQVARDWQENLDALIKNYDKHPWFIPNVKKVATKSTLKNPNNSKDILGWR